MVNHEPDVEGSVTADVLEPQGGSGVIPALLPIDITSLQLDSRQLVGSFIRPAGDLNCFGRVFVGRFDKALA